METPLYIKSLLKPNGNGKRSAKRVWSIDLETVWLPFFFATNTNGETAIAPDALGAPLRLAYNPDGSVKFSRSGRPIIKVAKDIADHVKLIRENFTATLQSYANSVITENPDGYKAEVEKARQAGEPIINRDKHNLDQAIAKMHEEEIAQVMAQARSEPESVIA